MEIAVVIIYGLSLLFIFLFSLGQLHLAWHYKRSKKEKTQSPVLVADVDLPVVTVQLPIFNELYVVERLIDCIAEFDYPIDKLEIQLLDDSTDNTVEVVAEKVAFYKAKGLDIQHVCRENRVGFKAGALDYGMQICKGEFIAIFDADFLPDSDFLKKTVMHFGDEKTGVVQTRWGHINKDYSLLTKLQAFGLDAHFSIEQTGRSHAGSFINFNGTAGVWRKRCIADAGGWSFDTLTEDLDLSYRAQMKGWNFRYLEDVVAPAELPVLMPAIKSQQFRWNKGAAETARKNLWNVFKTKISFTSKIHAVFHLFNSSVFLFLLSASIMSIPMLYVKFKNPEFEILFDIGSVFLIGFFSITFFYWVAAKKIKPVGTARYFLSRYPMFLTVSMGLSLHNAYAVLEGLLGFKSDFIRTPKFNIKARGDAWKDNKYIKPQLSFLTLLEGVLGLYFIFGIGVGFFLQDYGLMIFHVMLALGFSCVFYYSIRPIRYA